MECMNERAIVELLRHANACLQRFFEQSSHAPASIGDEDLRPLLHLHEVLESVGALLDAGLESATSGEIRQALARYRENLLRLRTELVLMQESALAVRKHLDSQRAHLSAARAWCAASRAVS